MSRIFILGDSFADNLYSKEKAAIDAGKPLNSGVATYIDFFIKNKIALPLYFDDWLKELVCIFYEEKANMKKIL